MSELPAQRSLVSSRDLHPTTIMSGAPMDYGYPAPVESDDTPFREYLAIFRRQKWLILGITAVVLGFVAYYVHQQRPVYQATAVLRLEDVRGAMTGGLGAEVAKEKLGGWNTDPILSQIQVLESRGLAAAVVDKASSLRLLPISPEFPPSVLRSAYVAPAAPGGDTLQLRFDGQGVVVQSDAGMVRAAYGQPVELAGVRLVVGAPPKSVESVSAIVLPRETAIGLLMSNLRATNRKNTDVIDVHYTHHDPRIAQRVVNVAAEEFQALNAHTAQRESRTRRIFLEARLRETQSQLQSAQRQLANFRSRNRVYSSAQQMAAQQQSNLDLQMRREELAANRQVYQSLLGRTRAGGGLRALGASAEVTTNPVMKADFEKLAQYEAARDSLTTGPWRKTTTHPDVQRLDKMIAATQERISSAAQSQLSALSGQIAALDGIRTRSSAQIQELPHAEEQEVFLLQQAETIGKLAAQLQEEHQKARIAEEVEAGQVQIVDLASIPASPVGTGRRSKLALGLILGLMLGGGGAIVREHLNSSIRRRDEIENILRIPGLAVIPQIASPRGGSTSLLRLRGGSSSRHGTAGAVAVSPEVNEGLVTAVNSHSTGAEAYRTLRTNLIFSQAVQTLKTIVVTSASPGEGKTTTAANLAVTFAQQGMRVLLVDCDLRRARLHKMFNVPREPGLTELALEHDVAANVIRETPVENLSVLTSGTLPPNPSELLGGPRMEAVLEQLRERFDVIVLDTPPLLAASDASVLGTKTDGVLLVVRAGQTERAAGQQAVQQLSTVGARIIGAVLNDPDAKVPQYGGYYQYEYYGEES